MAAIGAVLPLSDHAVQSRSANERTRGEDRTSFRLALGRPIEFDFAGAGMLRQWPDCANLVSPVVTATFPALLNDSGSHEYQTMLSICLLALGGLGFECLRNRSDRQQRERRRWLAQDQLDDEGSVGVGQHFEGTRRACEDGARKVPHQLLRWCCGWHS